MNVIFAFQAEISEQACWQTQTYDLLLAHNHSLNITSEPFITRNSIIHQFMVQRDIHDDHDHVILTRMKGAMAE